jgi:hypothetical protein
MPTEVNCVCCFKLIRTLFSTHSESALYHGREKLHCRIKFAFLIE